MRRGQRALCMMFNASDAAVRYNLSHVIPKTRWHLAIDTSHEVPHDQFGVGEEPVWKDARSYQQSLRSSAILLDRDGLLLQYEEGPC